MTTLQQAMAEINSSAENNHVEAGSIFLDTVKDVEPILETLRGFKPEDQNVVAVMLALFITALRRYPDLTV